MDASRVKKILLFFLIIFNITNCCYLVEGNPLRRGVSLYKINENVKPTHKPEDEGVHPKEAVYIHRTPIRINSEDNRSVPYSAIEILCKDNKVETSSGCHSPVK